MIYSIIQPYSIALRGPVSDTSSVGILVRSTSEDPLIKKWMDYMAAMAAMAIK
jgi:hypothetical protein